jgi:hypothetical protein
MNHDTQIVKADVVSGTAVIEPQFKVDRHSKKLCTAPTWRKLHEALYQAEELEETVVAIRMRLEGYPLDGIVAVNKAVDEIFGFTRALGGWNPPVRVNIETGFNRSATFAYGRLNPPAWENGWIEMQVDMENPLSLLITGNIKRKFEPSIKQVLELSKYKIQHESIYRNAAVELDLSYIEKIKQGNRFNPDHCAPRFIDLTQPPALILPRDLEMLLENKVWGRIERPEDFIANGIKIKNGYLLSGKYGTGKTLIATKTAHIAAANDYTYFYLKTPMHFVQAYRMAQIYARSVLFVEDIDGIFGGKRTHEMNMILETLDGLASKNAEVITVFTTNFPEKINEAFMRSGRIDKHIKLRELDAEAAGRFIQHCCGHELHPDVDYDAVGFAFRDLVPADIRGGIDEAKEQAIRQFGREISGKITTEILVTAGEVMRRERELTGGKENEAERDLEIVRHAERIKAPNGGTAVVGK